MNTDSSMLALWLGEPQASALPAATVDALYPNGLHPGGALFTRSYQDLVLQLDRTNGSNLRLHARAVGAFDRYIGGRIARQDALSTKYPVSYDRYKKYWNTYPQISIYLLQPTGVVHTLRNIQLACSFGEGDALDMVTVCAERLARADLAAAFQETKRMFVTAAANA